MLQIMKEVLRYGTVLTDEEFLSDGWQRVQTVKYNGNVYYIRRHNGRLIYFMNLTEGSEC